MANLFANLPLPVLNGPGAAVDVSGMGTPKTIIVTGDFQGATIAVEVSVDGGTVFAPLVSFQTGDHTAVLPVAAQFMRVNVSGRKTSVPFAATADVSASDIGALFSAIGMPVLNGPGVAVNVSALGVFATLVSGGVFQGATITVEGSDDGAAFAPIVQFAGQGGMASLEITANFIRSNVSGRKTTVPFTGSLAIGAVNDPIGTAGVDVEDESIPLAGNPHTTLNFLGAGVTAVDAGGGVANITIAGGIAGLVIEDEGAPIAGNPHTILNFTGAGITATDVAGVATITVPIGTPVIEDEGTPLAGAPHTTVNYVGAGVIATNAGGGVATITIPSGTPVIEDEGTPLAGAPHTILNFVGSGVTAANAGGGVATITVPIGTPVLEEEGVPIAGAPHTIINYVGAGITVANAGGGVATVTVPIDGTPQRFSYTVTGVEADLSELTIPLPAARANALYQVTPSQGTATFGLHMNVANASRTVAQFVLSLSGDATAGDVFWFTVADPT